MGIFTFKLPDIGEGTTEAEIAAWHVEVGAVIREEDPLLDLTTNKATVEVTSPVHGTVLARHGEVGDVRAIGTDLLVIDTGGASLEATPPEAAAPRVEAPRPEPVPRRDAAPPGEALRREPAPRPESAPRPLAAPAVRKAARDRGLDLARVAGTGPEGRVTHADLDRHGAGPAPSDDRVTPLRIVGVRRQIAERLQDAHRRIPHFSYVEEVDVTALEALRADLNAEPGAPRLTLLPFLALALVKALPGFPQINARFDDEAGVLHQHAALHLGIAAQTPNGLLVPVLRHAEALDLYGLGAGIGRLAAAARAGTLKPAELSGSTLTLTSLGALGGIAATPVINAPETAIVGVNRIVERPVVRDGTVVVRKMMNLSSSFDHRIVDGFDAARFIQAVRSRLEQPARLFLSPPPDQTA